MKKRIILKRLLLSTAVLTVASTAIIVHQHNAVDKTVKTEEVSKQDLASSSSETNKVEAKNLETKSTKSTTSTNVEEKPVDTAVIKEVAPSECPVATKLVEKPVVETKVAEQTKFASKPVDQPKVEKPTETKPVEQPKTEVPAPKDEQPKAETPKVEAPVVEKPVKQPKAEKPVVAEKPTTLAPVVEKPAPQTKVEAPKAETPAPKVEAPVIAEKGEALVQPELPEYHEAKGEPEVQPALTELVVPSENTQSEQPVVSEKGEPLVQPELPEFHSEKGTPEIQPELPEFHFETGDALVQPELPEYHEQKGEPLVQPELSEYTIKTVTREEVIPVPAESVTVTNPELNEGETEIVTQPKDGLITRIYEDILDEHDNVLSTKLVNETRVEAIKGVTSIGTKPVKKVFGETGIYRFSEHLSDENILEFREDVKLTADEIHALGQDEINKRVEQNLENTITVQDKQRQNLSHMDSAPLSDETINNLNGDTYINHKNIGLKVLELVNAERKRLGVHELTWSDSLYTLAKVRANEVRENGSIRFYTEDGQTLKHVRDNKGTPWYTVRDNTEFEDSALGENLAGYSIRPNVYKAFSEKYIADQLYNQWKNSPHHYANMIKEKFYQFAFDVAYSKFWRDGHTDVTYKKQGVLGVQLFADEGY